MIINETEYFYVRNGQGDITGLIDSNGIQVVNYVYDTWGKLINITGSLASTVGEKNPYRYRGYRYDTETGLYYLQSRYYNPEWGRFINADDTGILQLTQGELLSVNLYSYCGNNPVNNIDPSGLIFEEIINDVKEFGNQAYYISKNTNTIIIGSVMLDIMSVGSKNGNAGSYGFNSFSALKIFLGSPGIGKEWHHIVEQSQIIKSGFSKRLIQNINNIIPIDKATHAKISGYYNTKTFAFTKGMSVRDWLSGQSFEAQYEFGIKILKRYGVIK